MEIIKLVLCSTILICSEKSLWRFLHACRKAIIDDPIETAKICVPAAIYTLQNNLYYIALSNLESTTFCVAYQMKILTTALMLRFILHKPLSKIQWIALFVLVVGVSDVQLQYQPPQQAGKIEQQPALGLAAVVGMCLTSAFAGKQYVLNDYMLLASLGVYLEKVLKQSNVNVWMQNIRLASFGFFVSIFSMWFNDSDSIMQDGFLRGFDTTVWVMTFTNSAGGLLIAIVMKYADNIVKAYAQSAAIIGAAVGSSLLFDFSPNIMFLIGTLLVAASVYLYNAYPYRNLTSVPKVLEEEPVVVRSRG
ncbi:Protein NSTP-3 [Aphelenchoides avenae]|nr:Protein NSTP-3 [Aphelenchus avenae]